MAEDQEVLPKGLRFFNPHENSPSWVIGQLVITMNELYKFCKDNPDFLSEHNGETQLKVGILVSKKGKLYGKVDTYKKEDQPAGRVPDTKSAIASASTKKDDDDLPF